MKAVKVDLTNCYGIKKLESTFDFSQRSAYTIYAPNGAMKSSLAQTFRDQADGNPSRDRIFPNRTCVRTIADENGTPLPKESILVLLPYDEFFGSEGKVSTLLVDAKLRREYEQLHADIDKAKEAFLAALKIQSGSKRDLEDEISRVFIKREVDDAFFVALIRIRDELAAQKEAPFSKIPYDMVFDEKVLAFLETKDFKTAIKEYVTKYNELIGASTYFKKGTFNYYHASTIAKSLAENGFFDAKHTVYLNASEKLEITTQAQLEELIKAEKERITEDKALRKKFGEIEKLLAKNITVRSFESYLTEHEAILPKLENVEGFKEEVWMSYIKESFSLYQDLIEKYLAAEKRKREIEVEASKQRTQWESVIEIFNDRFFVPFKLVAQNKVSVILKSKEVLKLGFTFADGNEQVAVEKKTLMESLSTGEKKALYVLNIIFEIELRRNAQQDTILVIDDIADSFDYKNKYAIIEYLKDISEQGPFKQIILTHNFDFFRTICSRFVGYNQCLMASKSESGIQLQKASGIKNVFINVWKPHFFTTPREQLASIPFLRNLIEYTRDDTHADFLKLTSLLHWKSDTDSILVRDLDGIYTRLFSITGTSANPSEKVYDVLVREATACLGANDSINFENKIVLSIAIRLKAERYMIGKINDAAFVGAIKEKQTHVLFTKFKAMFPMETAAIGVIHKVSLMTPENIHLNSFMYEPILDMSDEHLRKLFGAVSTLK